MNLVRYAALQAPLRYLYLNGPRLQITTPFGALDLGFWQGLPLKDICAQMTRTPSDVWALDDVACAGTIDRAVHALEVGVLAIGYCTVLYQALRGANRAVATIITPKSIPSNTHVSSGGPVTNAGGVELNPGSTRGKGKRCKALLCSARG